MPALRTASCDPGEPLGRVQGGVGGHGCLLSCSLVVDFVTAARKRVSEEPRPERGADLGEQLRVGRAAGRDGVPSMSSGSGTSVAVLTTGGATSR